MFYYPTVLKRHTGCFSTVWLVATKGISVTRRDFLKVNVKNTCDDIMNYVLEQVPPPQPGLPRPRFSLYLSSQLQYGVILVYHRQCAILLAELQSVVNYLLKQSASQKIDVDEHGRHALDVPDALSLLVETEGALDPLFGVMCMGKAMPSPNTLIQMGPEYLRETSPEHPERPSPTSAVAPESGITATPETITLRETEPVAIPIAEFEGEELIDQYPETVGFLLDQTDNFPEGELEMLREEVTPGEQEGEMERGLREEDLEKERTKELTGSSIELQPTTLSIEKPGPPSDQLTPVSMPVLPSPPSTVKERQRQTLQSEDVLPPEVRRKRRRRKRQLIFFDPETQIPQEVLQQQINNPLFETRSPLFAPPPSHRMRPAAELLQNPCLPFLPDEVLFLWRRAATIRPFSGLDQQVGERGPESTDSEKEREREIAEVAEREEGKLELPKEVPRDVAESEKLDFSEHGSLPLEGSSQREASREIISPMFTPDKEWSAVSRSVSTLQDIPEVVDELLGSATDGSPPGQLLDLPEHGDAPVLFQSLLPPEVDRRTVSNIFQRLLETLSAKKLRVEQNEPYGDILIFPGSNYEEGNMDF
ncbi:meiotic recombination protein REC8 homolog [Etheostoma spectabile]|uniref:meiotic recombination protein REC8 homolog n=1 Tax=Etheostoma spectabile TaxID=54343 RepID=UPI0013AFB224|nr:meiotic recombination protein REC8 homolog [Etheostoma spectabile]